MWSSYNRTLLKDYYKTSVLICFIDDAISMFWVYQLRKGCSHGVWQKRTDRNWIYLNPNTEQKQFNINVITTPLAYFAWFKSVARTFIHNATQDTHLYSKNHWHGQIIATSYKGHKFSHLFKTGKILVKVENWKWTLRPLDIQCNVFTAHSRAGVMEELFSVCL